MPGPQRFTRQPVVAPGPVRTVGGEVQRGQNVTVRGGTLHAWTVAGRNSRQPVAERPIVRYAQRGVGVEKRPERQSGEREGQRPRQRVATDAQLREPAQPPQGTRDRSRESVVAQVEGHHAAQRVGAHAVPCLEHDTPTPAAGLVPVLAVGGPIQPVERRHVPRVTEFLEHGDSEVLQPACERGRARDADRGQRRVEFIEVIELQEALRDGAREGVPVGHELLETAQIGELTGDAAGEGVPVNQEFYQFGEFAEFGRQGVRQPVYGEPQNLEVCEATEFGRNRALQGVADECQLPEAAEPAEFGRDHADEIVAFEIQLGDPALRVYADAPPVSNRQVRQPVFVVGPAWAVGDGVESGQDQTIRVGAVQHLHARIGRGLVRHCRDRRHPDARATHQPRGVHGRDRLVTRLPGQFGRSDRVAVRVRCVRRQAERVAHGEPEGGGRKVERAHDLFHGDRGAPRRAFRTGAHGDRAVPDRRRESRRADGRDEGITAHPCHRGAAYDLPVLVTHLGGESRGVAERLKRKSGRVDRERRGPGGRRRRWGGGDIFSARQRRQHRP